MDRTRPPERIEVADAGVVLRRHRLDDVDALHAVIEESRDHVRPFMPWADQSRDDTAGFVTTAVERWDSGEDFSFLVTGPAEPEADEPERLLGGAGLHSRPGPGAFEIGYWLRPDATGRGVMTAVAGCLADVALSLAGVERVEIHCDEANVRSAAVPRRLGFTLDRMEDTPITSPGEHGRHMIWVRRRPTSPA